MTRDKNEVGTEHVWIREQGPGPLVLVRKSMLESWRGVNAPAGERSDYGRACAIGEVGCVELKGGSALVLGDDPLETTWLPKAQGGMFVRWIAADSEAAALAATEAGADATWTPTGCTFTTAGGVHVLFPASVKGSDSSTGASLSLELLEGDYNVTSAILEHDEATVLVYRLLWRPKARS